jgi:hypothetical protein
MFLAGKGKNNTGRVKKGKRKEMGRPLGDDHPGKMFYRWEGNRVTREG